MTGPFVPVRIFNPIRAVVGIPHHRFNLFVKCSSKLILKPLFIRISAISRAGRAMIAVAYAGGLFSGVSGVSRSNGLMTARITLVATCA